MEYWSDGVLEQALIERRSGYLAPGDVRGSRLINARSISRRGIAGIMRVQLCTGESGSPPILHHSAPPLSAQTFWLSSCDYGSVQRSYKR